MKDFHILPKVRDSLSYLYIEHAVIERDHSALLVFQETGKTAVPIANLCLVMIGPGTNITHAAIGLLAEHGCSVLWTGEDGSHYYAQGLGETHRAYHVIQQAEMVSDPKKRLQVVLRMYEKRFGFPIDPGLSIEQIRGMEGGRMRNAYLEASQRYGVAWSGRRYDRNHWERADPINRAISAANALLSGLCHAAIVAGGYSPALGFLHTGKQLSFVYDVADLYKTEITIPIAFRTVSISENEIEKHTREACREEFREKKLLERILPDIDQLLGISGEIVDFEPDDYALPETWWHPQEAEMGQ